MSTEHTAGGRPSTPQELVRALVARLLCSGSRDAFISWIAGVDAGFGAAIDKLSKSEAAAGLLNFEGTGVLDAWTLADVVWRSILSDEPSRGAYPFGQAGERAVKRVIIEMTTRDDANETWPALRRTLQMATQRRAARRLRARLVAGVLFELCLDQLRRPDWGTEHDTASWFVLSSRGRVVPYAREQAIRQALFGACQREARSWMTAIDATTETGQAIHKRRKQKPYVNVIVGSIAASKLESVCDPDEDSLRLALHGSSANTMCRDQLRRAVGSELPPVLADLVDIGVAVYMADLYTRRDPYVLSRRLSLLIPVRELDRWQSAKDDLRQVVSILGRDVVDFVFVSRGERLRHAKLPIPESGTCISLLSGGLDSAAGAIWALRQGLKPTFLSHYGNYQLSLIQQHVVRLIAGSEVDHVSLFVGKSKKHKHVRHKLGSPKKSVMAQHLRAFLFLTLAAALAIERGIGTILICEAGPIALNPPFSEARVNTRTAHPWFLGAFSRFVKGTVGADLEVFNPFLTKTKGEVTALLDGASRELLGSTVSCEAWFKVPLLAQQRSITEFSGRHCGECLPCITRRAAVYRAHLESPDTEYLTDVFKEQLLGDSFLALAEELRFAQTISRLEPSDILARSPEFSVYEPGIVPSQLVDTYRRHANEMLSCFRDLTSPEVRHPLDAALT